MFVGTESEARAELEGMLSASSEPALDSAEIDRLLTGARRADGHGLAPSDDEWEGTWDLDSAAEKGWMMKAGKYSNRIDFSAAGQSFSAHQTPEFCLKMAAEHRSKIVASARPASRYGRR